MNNILDVRTRSSQNWKSLPGNFDVLNLSTIYPSNNEFGIPSILSQDFIPSDLVMYGAEVRRPKKDTVGKTIHFYLDDYKFETLWNRPIQTLSTIQRIGSALSPDFSLFVDYPIAVQVWNTYRNRWIGRYWQDNNIKVIPTLVWGDTDSFDFCFKGVGKYSTVSISTVGLKHPEAKKSFCIGFEEMCKQLEPKRLIVHGEIRPLDFEAYIKNTHYYATYWAKRREELK